MKAISQVVLLEQLIAEKEASYIKERDLLKITFQTTYQSLRPINLIKSTIKEVITAPDLKNNLTNTLIGFVTGWITKKLVVGTTHNPLTKLVGMITEVVVANKVSNNVDGIKHIGGILFKKLIQPSSNGKSE